MVPHVAPWEREAQGFLETLFPTTLAADECIEARWRSLSQQSMSRAFFANTQDLLGFVSKARNTRDIYIGVAPRQGRVGTKEGVIRLPAMWADLDAKEAHTRETRFKQLTDSPSSPR